MFKKITVQSSQKEEIIDITSQIQQIIRESKVKNGALLAFATHTTCALFTLECDSGLNTDLFNFLHKLKSDKPFNHLHSDNIKGKVAHPLTHVIASLVGQSAIIPVSKGFLTLGIWQKLCLLELDGPKERNITLSFL